MDAFALLSLILLPVAFLVLGAFRQRIVRVDQYWMAMNYWIIAMILYYPVSGLFMIGAYLSIVAQPAALVIGFFGVYRLCMSMFPDAQGMPTGGGDIP
jgi:hypothetical protein